MSKKQIHDVVYLQYDKYNNPESWCDSLMNDDDETYVHHIRGKIGKLEKENEELKEVINKIKSLHMMAGLNIDNYTERDDFINSLINEELKEKE
jgi:hypothetical protein